MSLLSLVKQVIPEIKGVVDQRLSSFSSFKDLPDDAWFSELCFCILTANSKAETAINIQKELHTEGFLRKRHQSLSSCIRNNKHRFHNNKAKYIIEARKFKNIKSIVHEKLNDLDQVSVRNWVAESIKGIGYKEASHFLRNVGFFDVAILDRHILRMLSEYNYITLPKSLSKNHYLHIESVFSSISKELNMSPGELDLYVWYLVTGKVLK